jgi:hypothetical protein
VALLNSLHSVLSILVYENKSSNHILSNWCEIFINIIVIVKTTLFSLPFCYFFPFCQLWFVVHFSSSF